ncbi:MAG: DUF3634 family protein [Gammaproteobacteria bacterium]|nr:DUF3634 family protein [Gammaproteobacteria bacterium]
MTLSFAILLVVILLLYDAMFLRLLLKRKGRVRFILIIENGEIIKTEGKVPENFYQSVKSISHEYQPASLKITVKKSTANDQIEFSLPINEELKQKIEIIFNQS